MNGERVIVVVESTPGVTCLKQLTMVHRVLHITGKKFGRVLMCTEVDNEVWERQTFMTRLD